MTPLTTPTVHANGTPKEKLVQQRLAVMEAASALLEAMQAAQPENRDYLPQGLVAVKQARAAWSERLQMVQELRAQVEMEAVEITLKGL